MDFILEEKRWTKDIEKEIIEEWEKTQDNEFNKDTNKPVYSIDTPPPYINTPIHIGHATTYVCQDMFARYKRQKGYEVLFPLGLDRNGLPIEVAAEKKYKVDLTKLSREEAVDYCEKILEETTGESVESFKNLGVSFSSYKKHDKLGSVYHTDSPEYRTLTQDTFIDLWNKGLIYEDERINNWDPKLKTTISDSEIEYKEIETNFSDIVFKCKETQEELIIGTTRPELVASCGMVIFNPKDDRYKHLEGKTAITPLYNREVPIKAHTMAKMDKGTGLVMMCSAGDLSDIRFFREQGIAPIISINQNGTMNSNTDFLEGLYVKKARKKMIELLEESNLLKSTKRVIHKVPVSERSGAEIEFIAMKEYYLKQIEFIDEIKKVSNNMNFFAKSSKTILDDWLDAVSIDWPISRRRFYGTEIPVWHCRKCSYAYVPKKGEYHKPWKEDCPIDKCPECGSKEFEGEKKIFDTWFDSATSPLYILGYRTDKDFFDRVKKCSLRPQGKEIVRTWLYYTLLKDYLLVGREIFEDVWIHNHVVDEKGYKMSKSKGNGIDPKDVLNQFGTEPFRLWCALEGNIVSDDLRCSFDRIKGASKTVTKLWNASRFISSFKMSSDKYELRDIDKWILSQTDELVKDTQKAYDNYDFHNPAVKIRNFLWETFSSHYLELVKRRVYDEEGLFSEEEKNGAVYTLNEVLKVILKLLFPVTPLITYKTYKELYKQDISKLSFPVLFNVESKISKDEIENLNGEIWKYKKDSGISLKDSIKSFKIPRSLKSISKDIKVMHNIENVEFK